MGSPRRSKPRRSSRPRSIISACLAGYSCTYDAGHKLDFRARRMVQEGIAIPVCPEIMGGLTTPRVPAEIMPDGRVVNRDGRDVTAEYRTGARACLAIARRFKIRKAILKAKSPACGYGAVYDGTFRHILRPGHGILTQLLLKHHFTISSR